MASSISNKPRIFGILNVTPDSFSDGGEFLEKEAALSRAAELKAAGADYIDIGGDSTRPGSVCTGDEIEWKRIKDLVVEISKNSKVSVDTHHAKTAELAIAGGAEIINDISSGFDPQMFKLIAKSGKKIILTYTRCAEPHNFLYEPEGDIIFNICSHFNNSIKRARKAGIELNQIILDPGMGAFLSAKADASWRVLANLSAFSGFNLPLMLSVSRKGFFKQAGEKIPQERDLASAFVSVISQNLSGDAVKYHRLHSPAGYKLLSGN